MAILDAATAAKELLLQQWHLFLVPAVVYFAIWLFQTYLQESDLSKIPFAGTGLGDEAKRRAGYIASAGEIYIEGARKFKNGIFRITTTRSMKSISLSCPYDPNTDPLLETPVVVIDPKFLTELKDLPDNHISFSAAIHEVIPVSRFAATVKLVAETDSMIVNAHQMDRVPRG